MAPNEDQWETVMLRHYECFPTLSRTPRRRGQQVTSLTRVHSPIKVPVVKGLGTTYLFYVRHILRGKISASLVEDAVQPAVFYFRVVHDLNHVSLLEIQEGGVLCHVIVQGTYVLRFLWWRDKRGTLPKKSGSYSPDEAAVSFNATSPKSDPRQISPCDMWPVIWRKFRRNCQGISRESESLSKYKFSRRDLYISSRTG